MTETATKSAMTTTKQTRKPRKIIRIKCHPLKTKEAPVTRGHVFMADLEPNQCRWPTGVENKKHVFCGCQRVTGSPYCEAHTIKAHR